MFMVCPQKVGWVEWRQMGVTVSAPRGTEGQKRESCCSQGAGLVHASSRCPAAGACLLSMAWSPCWEQVSFLPQLRAEGPCWLCQSCDTLISCWCPYLRPWFSPLADMLKFGMRKGFVLTFGQCNPVLSLLLGSLNPLQRRMWTAASLVYWGQVGRQFDCGGTSNMVPWNSWTCWYEMQPLEPPETRDNLLLKHFGLLQNKMQQFSTEGRKAW